MNRLAPGAQRATPSLARALLEIIAMVVGGAAGRRLLAIATAVAVAAASSVSAQRADAERASDDGCDRPGAREHAASTVEALVELGDCREHMGRLASAWVAFTSAARAASDAGAGEASRRAAAIEPRLSYLTIAVPPSSQIARLTVTRNGTPVDRSLWNVAVPVDAGAYEIGASAPGRDAWSTQVAITAERQRVVVEVPQFHRLPTVPDEPDEPREDVRAYADAPRRWSRMRYVAVGVGGLGIAAVVAGAARGKLSREAAEMADLRCPQIACPDHDAVRASEHAHNAALQADALFAVGGIAIASAVTLWFLGGVDDDDVLRVTPMISRSDAGLAVGGRF